MLIKSHVLSDYKLNIIDRVLTVNTAAKKTKKNKTKKIKKKQTKKQKKNGMNAKIGNNIMNLFKQIRYWNTICLTILCSPINCGF
jgi:hypothetical protein